MSRRPKFQIKQEAKRPRKLSFQTSPEKMDERTIEKIQIK